MSWLQGSNFASLAKNAVKEAQKKLDSALDIQEHEFGLDQSTWGSFTGSFFEAKDYLKNPSTEKEDSESLIAEEPGVVLAEPKSSSDLLTSVTTVQPLSNTSSLLKISENVENDEEDDDIASTDSAFRDSLQSSTTNITDTLISSTTSTSRSGFSVISSTIRKNEELDIMDNSVEGMENGENRRDSTGFEECDLNDSSNNEEEEDNKNNSIICCDPVIEVSEFQNTSAIMTSCGPELLIHEAMIDQSEKRSEAGSSSSKSYEVVKAINSGHTSGDELETHTSSSDIEIISSPPPSTASSISSHHRCISPSCKKDKQYCDHKETVITDDETIKEAILDNQLDYLQKVSVSNATDEKHTIDTLASIEISHTRTGSELSISGSDETSQTEIDRLLKKIKDMNEILDAREYKIVELSRCNIELQEKSTDLSSQIKEAMKINNKLTESTLTAEEFTTRLSNMEKKLQKTLAERDSLKDEVKAMKQEFVKRKREEEWKEMIEERDSTISDLRCEGESLSKEVGKYSELVKKLRSKDKNNDKEIKALKSELETKNTDFDRLKKSSKTKDENESNHILAIQNLSSLNSKLEKEKNKLKLSVDEVTEKSDNLRSSLENSYKEIAELKRQMSEKEDAAHEVALSKEMTAKIALQEQLRDLQEKSILEKETLYTRMDELRSSLNSAERGASHREEQLCRQRDDLQCRLEESENRLAELSSTVSAATLPLQRQIESLQTSLRETQSSSDKLEQTLNERLQYMTIQLGAAQERDRSVSEQYMNLSAKYSSLEVKYQELIKIEEYENNELTDLKQRFKIVEESKKRELSSILSKNSSLSQELSEAIKKCQLHEVVFQNEKIKLETKINHLEGLYQDRESKMKEMQQNLDKNNLERYSCRSSPSQFSSISEQWGDESIFDNSRMRNNNSFYDSVRVGGSSLASLVENYQFSLRQRDGEVSQLQAEISSLEKIRDSMTMELSNLSIKVDKLNEVEDEVKSLTQLYKETEEKYQTMLTMYGEKVEETEELKLDLQDVKEMYKVQIQELLQSQRNS
ncbi:TATA element modulatory factor isoform X1 [Lepeophtheirus salmonis]|uniref:TATA element modulatory factor isoform X1 n=1 Tax=Lepeophtheirus salmonis TaxID=72036 RepID=UPI001AE26E87|nr:TATA element modulatory factor-like isoform X1 [Lepeophtheirus salmonis]